MPMPWHGLMDPNEHLIRLPYSIKCHHSDSKMLSLPTFAGKLFTAESGKAFNPLIWMGMAPYNIVNSIQSIRYGYFTYLTMLKYLKCLQEYDGFYENGD